MSPRFDHDLKILGQRATEEKDSAAINRDCRLFRGSVPCRPNKLYNRECSDCGDYVPSDSSLLFIKLDAAGDVVRSGALLPALKEKHPTARICWITRSEFLALIEANPYVDEALPYDVTGLSLVQARKWDFVYSLSNDLPSAALATLAAATQAHFGYHLDKNGLLCATNEAAWSWLKMAAFDRVKRANQRSYQELMYDIAECSPPISRPCISLTTEVRQRANDVIIGLFSEREQDIRIVGINVGSGARWPKKMLDGATIARLCKGILEVSGAVRVVLFGGAAEKEKIDAILALLDRDARVVSAGTDNSMLEFAALIERCAVLVTGDTLALHLATAFSVPTIAVFGPTSLPEIYDYGGSVARISSDLECLGCYADCRRTVHCMNSIPDTAILDRVKLFLTKPSVAPAK